MARLYAKNRSERIHLAFKALLRFQASLCVTPIILPNLKGTANNMKTLYRMATAQTVSGAHSPTPTDFNKKTTKTLQEQHQTAWIRTE